MKAIFTSVLIAASIISAQAETVTQNSTNVNNAEIAEKVVRVEQSHLVNINTASIEQLTQIKGIGKKKAEAIVAHRELYGSFKTIDDLLQVKGVGSKLLEKLRASVQI